MKKLVSLCTAAVLCLTLLASCAPKPDSSSPSPSPDAEPVDLAAFAQSVQENHQFASLEKADPADEELGAIMLENNYPGLKDMDLEQTEVYLPMISFSGGELKIPAQARCLYLDENDALGCVRRELTVTCPMEEAGEGVECEAEAACRGDIIANILPEGIELRAPLECAAPRWWKTAIISCWSATTTRTPLWRSSTPCSRKRRGAGGCKGLGAQRSRATGCAAPRRPGRSESVPASAACTAQ